MQPLWCGAVPGVLVVEDQAIVRLELVSIVTHAGFELAGEAGTPLEAIRIADERKPDIALLDINLAGHWEGLDLAQHLRDEFSTRIVFVSGFSDGLADRIERLHPDAVVAKPFTADDIVDALTRADAARRSESGSG